MATPAETTASPVAATVEPVLPSDWTIADVLRHLGDISPERVRAFPPPGTATEKDVVDVESRTGRICELVDGILVEKAMGFTESLVACTLISLLREFLDKNPLGVVVGEAGMMRILPRRVRIPDVAFIAWERFSHGEIPRDPIPAIAPDLAIEVLSPSNTRGEMARKLEEYFRAGSRLVWYIDPQTRTAVSYTAPDQAIAIGEDGVLDGLDVLPSFRLSLAELFARSWKKPVAEP